MPPLANSATCKAKPYICCNESPGMRTSAAKPRVCSLSGTPPTSSWCLAQRYASCTITGAPANLRNDSNPVSKRWSIFKSPQQWQAISSLEKCGLSLVIPPQSKKPALRDEAEDYELW